MPTWHELNSLGRHFVIVGPLRGANAWESRQGIAGIHLVDTVRVLAVVARYLRRHFWVFGTLFGVLVATACGLLALRGAGYLNETSRLAPPVPSLHPASPVAVSASAQSATEILRDGDAIVARNMFCSACAPSSDEPAARGRDDADLIPLTGLPLELLATSVATRPGDSVATIRNTSTSQQGAFGIDDRIPGGGLVQVVGGTTVLFHNESTQRVERLSLTSVVATKAGSNVAQKRVTVKRGRFAERVRSLGNGAYEVDSTLMRELTNNPMSIRGVRFAPQLEGDSISGFRLTYARPDSLATALGLRRGDVVQSINGLRLDNPSKLLDVFTRLREQRRFQATVLRGGKRVTLSYTVS